MKVFCRTNIDELKREDWPERMCCRPVVGDRVCAKSGINLRVVGVMHSITKQYENDATKEPFLIVELHK